MAQLYSWFNNYCLKTPVSDPDNWFVVLDFTCKGITEVNPKYEKRELENTSQMINRIPDKCNNLHPVVKCNNLSFHIFSQTSGSFGTKSSRRITVKRLLSMHQSSMENVVPAGSRGTNVLIAK